MVGAKLDWDDPRKMNSTNTGCLGIVVGFVFMVVTAVIFLGAPVGAALLQLGESTGQAIGLLVGSAICLAGAVIPPWLVRGRVSSIGN